MLPEKWPEVPLGCYISEPGNSAEYLTGTWRSQCPILDTDKCSSCLRCWVFCPEGAIQVKESKVTGIDLKYCKGCGICFTECPQHAIEMIEETVAKKGV